MKDKIFDVILFVGGVVIILVGVFSTYGYWFGTSPTGYLFHPDSTNWSNFTLMIIGVAMIVFGFVRRSWRKKDE
jgi:hypothetical protein